MGNKNHNRQIKHVLWAATLSLFLVFFGVPMVAAIAGESHVSTGVLLALIVCSYSTLYLR